MYMHDCTCARGLTWDGLFRCWSVCAQTRHVMRIGRGDTCAQAEHACTQRARSPAGHGLDHTCALQQTPQAAQARSGHCSVLYRRPRRPHLPVCCALARRIPKGSCSARRAARCLTGVAEFDAHTLAAARALLEPGLAARAPWVADVWQLAQDARASAPAD